MFPVPTICFKITPRLLGRAILDARPKTSEIFQHTPDNQAINRCLLNIHKSLFIMLRFFESQAPIPMICSTTGTETNFTIVNVLSDASFVGRNSEGLEIKFDCFQGINSCKFMTSLFWGQHKNINLPILYSNDYPYDVICNLDSDS